MSTIRRLAARLLALVRLEPLDRDHRDEADSHLALATEDYMRQGLPRPEAQRRARLAFGSSAAAADAHRDARGVPWLESFAFDARLAARGLVQAPWFSLAAVAMLTLALGLNTGIFAVVDAMLFRGFAHVVRNDQLLYMQELDRTGRRLVAYTDFEAWRQHAHAFQGLAYIGTFTPIALSVGADRARDLTVITVSTHTFGLLGVAPLLGRDFVAADGAAGASPVLLLSYRYWVAQFGGRHDLIGSAVEINGAPATIIGVMPEGFDFPMRESGWMPVVDSPVLQRRGITPGGFTVVGRLKDGVARAEATAELETINHRLEAAFPDSNAGVRPTVANHAEMMSGTNARLVWGSLWLATLLVFVIACANLASLALMRTLGRWREFVTKAALGSGLSRLLRQLLLEHVALAVVAGALAWSVTTGAVRTWVSVTASQYQILNYVVDRRTLGYLVGLSLAAVALMSIGPLWRIRRLAGGNTLSSPARGVTHDRSSRRLGTLLVASQMALTLVLLSGAGVLVRSMRSIVGADTGVRDPRSLVVGVVRPPPSLYPDAEARHQYFERVTSAVADLPGVERSSFANTIPIRFSPPRAFEIEGRASRSKDEAPALVVSAGTDYFHTLGAQVRIGREFEARDNHSAPVVAIVNEAFAVRYWPGQSALGRRLRTTEGPHAGQWREVVGVVSNLLQADPLRQDFKPLVYVPFLQEPAPGSMWFMIRTAAPPSDMAAEIRRRVESIDHDVPLTNVGTFADRLAFDRDSMDAEHSELGKHATVTQVLATVALLLAAGGLAAVLAHAVRQRTSEVGVRMAVGATPSDIRRLVTREGMRPVLAGLVIGLPGSVALAWLLQSQIVGISPYDPLTFGLAATATVGAALIACRLPARRAARVDPMVALRHE